MQQSLFVSFNFMADLHKTVADDNISISEICNIDQQMRTPTPDNKIPLSQFMLCLTLLKGL